MHISDFFFFFFRKLRACCKGAHIYGSGADIIAKGWEENHWARPTIKDSYFPSEETELILDLLKPVFNTVSNGVSNEVSNTASKWEGTTAVILQLIKENPSITRTDVQTVYHGLYQFGGID